MSSPYTTVGLPPDGAAWAALVLAAAFLPARYWLARRSWRPPPRLVVPALGVAATALSAAYVAYYLRGGPRIIDATSYYLQARSFAHGLLSFPVLGVTGSFRGRFLLSAPDGSLAVIFPPGYALFLALGFSIGEPMGMGPLLAGLLVVTTYGLAKELTQSEHAALLSATFSLLSAALRYHTADTMSHGLSALLLCAATWSAIRPSRRYAFSSGIAIGWLIATRPVTGSLGALLALAVMKPGYARAAAFTAGLLPGVGFLMLYQHAATGSFGSSPQLTYYALADGPADCFRYGFGSGVGCLHEHGDYVRARLSSGYGLREALGVALRRLALHSIDIQNAAPLSLLVPLGAWLGRKTPGVPLIFFGCLGLVVAYAPFYFDASYPGGGARLFADVLPLEHVLLAIAVERLRLCHVALPFSLVGFALHASYSHRALAEREGGRPMFEAAVLAKAGVHHGLVFVDTDHGFNLGHEPGQFDARRHVLVARYAGDDHDFALWDLLHRPPSFHYRYQPARAPAEATVTPYTPTVAAPGRLRFEAEAEWPPFAVAGGWVEPAFVSCASGGRGLRLHPTRAGAPVQVEIAAPTVADAAPIHELHVGWVNQPGPASAFRLTVLGLPSPGATPSKFASRHALVSGGAGSQMAGGGDCVDLSFDLRALGAPKRLRLEASRGGVLDYSEVVQ